jgi:glycosyltransferase involved in cell wall biosynthesis
VIRRALRSAKSSPNRNQVSPRSGAAISSLFKVIDVVLPTQNERDALPWVLDRIPDGYRPIVVDNASTDGSAAVASSLGAFVVHEAQRGFGAACKRGLDASTTDIICFMDCDGSLDPAELPLVAGPIENDEADLVLGARDPERFAWPVHARIANRMLALEIGRRTGVRLTDIGPMRAARRTPLSHLGIRDRRSGWPLEMVLSAIRAEWRIQETCVTYRRRSGRSKVTGTLRGSVEAIGDMGRVLR